jgi:hypothetical protein
MPCGKPADLREQYDFDAPTRQLGMKTFAEEYASAA